MFRMLRSSRVLWIAASVYHDRCLPLSSSSRLISPVASRLLSTSNDVVIPGTSSSSRRVGSSVPSTTAASVRIGTTNGFGTALGAVAVLGAVGALDAAPILGLVAVTAVMAFSVAVAATLNTGLGALGDVVSWLEAVEAGTVSTAASARLQRLGTLRLAVTKFGQHCRINT